MMKLSDNIHIQCSRCNHKFIIDKDFYELILVTMIMALMEWEKKSSIQ